MPECDPGFGTSTVDAAWRDEIARRLDEVLDGSVTLVNADEHYAELRARFGSRT